MFSEHSYKTETCFKSATLSQNIHNVFWDQTSVMLILKLNRGNPAKNYCSQ